MNFAFKSPTSTWYIRGTSSDLATANKIEALFNTKASLFDNKTTALYNFRKLLNDHNLTATSITLS